MEFRVAGASQQARDQSQEDFGRRATSPGLIYSGTEGHSKAQEAGYDGVAGHLDDGYGHAGVRIFGRGDTSSYSAQHYNELQNTTQGDHYSQGSCATHPVAGGTGKQGFEHRAAGGVNAPPMVFSSLDSDGSTLTEYEEMLINRALQKLRGLDKSRGLKTGIWQSRKRNKNRTDCCNNFISYSMGNVQIRFCPESSSYGEKKAKHLCDKYPPLMKRSIMRLNSDVTTSLAEKKVAYGNIIIPDLTGTGVKFEELPQPPHIVNMAASFRIDTGIARTVLAMCHPGACFNRKRFKSVMLSIIFRELSYRPTITMLIFDTGNVNVTGAHTGEQALYAAHVLVRMLRKFTNVREARVCDFKMTNTVVMTNVNFNVDLKRMNEQMGALVTYQPALFPPVRWHIGPKVLLIYESGRIVSSGCSTYEECKQLVEMGFRKSLEFRRDTGGEKGAFMLRMANRISGIHAMNRSLDTSRGDDHIKLISPPQALSKLVNSVSDPSMCSTDRRRLTMEMCKIMSGEMEGVVESNLLEYNVEQK